MIKRQLYYQLKKYLKAKEALVINGMRQVGKTTLLKQIFEEIQSPYKLFLDLENTLNQKYFEEINYEKINFLLRELAGADLRQKVYLFLDEIQHLKNLPSILKFLGDHYNYKFFLTGSVSFYLKNLFSESMAGRKFLFELFPLSFSEFSEFKKTKLSLPSLTKNVDELIYQTIQPAYEEYTKYGGFPSVVLAANREEKLRKINDIFASYFEKEIIGFADFRKNKTVRDLMLLLLRRSGQKLDTYKLCSELGISRITLAEYVSFLEATYFIKLIRPYSRSMDVEIRETPKVYICDSGLVNLLGKASFGQVLETAIFHQLYSQKQGIEGLNFNLNYYQRKTGAEIDFIVNKTKAIEVKETACLREQKKLEKLAQELKMKTNLLISYHFVKNTKVSYGFQI